LADRGAAARDEDRGGGGRVQRHGQQGRRGHRGAAGNDARARPRSRSGDPEGEALRPLVRAPQHGPSAARADGHAGAARGPGPAGRRGAGCLGRDRAARTRREAAASDAAGKAVHLGCPPQNGATSNLDRRRRRPSSPATKWASASMPAASIPRSRARSR
jgi:hypothetical protein